jgi:diguanylate cyclase (GGDEF)-like protein/hemerythrin-like metal-binding protein
MSLARRNAKYVALILLDLDDFKPVNDHYGHKAGDTVLTAIATRWLACIRETDTLARLGGDEFAVIVGELDVVSEAELIAQKLIKASCIDIPLHDQIECRVGVSAGISIYPENATEIDSLLTAADSAMYESKVNGKNHYSISQARPKFTGSASNWIEFEESQLIGVDEIDQQHKILVEMVNELNIAINSNYSNNKIRSLFDQLVKYTLFHFDSERQLMELCAYPDIESHNREHSKLINEVLYYSGHVSQGLEQLELQKMALYES